MAKNVFKENVRYKCKLFGHGFTRFPEKDEPILIGFLEKDTIETNSPVFGKKEFAIFTVEEPKKGNFPDLWVGTYRLNMAAKHLWFCGEAENK